VAELDKVRAALAAALTETDRVIESATPGSGAHTTAQAVEMAVEAALGHVIDYQVYQGEIAREWNPRVVKDGE
jgi:hypothetical protein